MRIEEQIKKLRQQSKLLKTVNYTGIQQDEKVPKNTTA